MWVYVCAYMHMSEGVCVNAYVRGYIFAYVRGCMYIYVCIWECVCMYRYACV